MLNSTFLVEYKELVEERLKGNEPALRQRGKDLLEQFKEFFGSSKARKSFINKIVNTRNYYTHWDASSEKEALSGEELYWASEKLRLLLIMLFLYELSFSQEEINTLLKRYIGTNSALYSQIFH